MRIEKKRFRMKKTISVACVVLCLLLTLPAALEFSVNAGSTDVTVGPGQSIQAAINSAKAGDTIGVLPGTYNESLQINKTISLMGEDRDQTVINGQNNQFVISITANNVTIDGFTIRSNLNPSEGINVVGSQGDLISHCTIEDSQQGIALTPSITSYSSNNTISGNTIDNNQQGITLSSSGGGNTISDNLITENQGGIELTTSSNNLFSGNVILNNSGSFYGGLYLYTSGGNVFSGNTFTNNLAGETISQYCFQNIFYHNNFNDTFQVDSSSPTNIWDSGGEGNYWSNYAGHNRGDGIGIESYPVALNFRDNHPLKGWFSSPTATFQGETYQIPVISNSTISDFAFEVGTETGNKIIRFNVTGAKGTVGFSRLTIPTELITAPIVVLVGDQEIVPTWLRGQNSTFNYLYFTYSHSNQTVLIIYNQLLANFLALNATYNELLNKYTSQLPIITSLLGMNETYNELLNNYANLLGNYSQLQQSYQNLNNSYQQHVTDYDQNLQNVRNLMYIFAAATAVLILATVYFSKHSYSGPAKGPEEKKPILNEPISSAVRV
ncbi:MAG TPA: NosD domain-containing protein [candidate division Zixibacteria bacterium]|nr:NosD domain-containing protein [candidate division Zixibacteria bacterium]